MKYKIYYFHSHTSCDVQRGKESFFSSIIVSSLSHGTANAQGNMQTFFFLKQQPTNNTYALLHTFTSEPTNNGTWQVCYALLLLLEWLRIFLDLFLSSFLFRFVRLSHGIEVKAAFGSKAPRPNSTRRRHKTYGTNKQANKKRQEVAHLKSKETTKRKEMADENPAALMRRKERETKRCNRIRILPLPLPLLFASLAVLHSPPPQRVHGSLAGSHNTLIYNTLSPAL
eukprot:gene8985-6307_t